MRLTEVPNGDRASLVAGDKPFAGGRERNRADHIFSLSAAWFAEFLERLAAGQVPDADDRVGSGGGKVFPVGMKDNIVDTELMRGSEFLDLLAVGRIDEPKLANQSVARVVIAADHN